MSWLKEMLTSSYSRLLEQHQMLRVLYLDLQTKLETKEREWTEERKELLDRIMVLTNPSSYRELHREPSATPRPVNPTARPRPTWPGAIPERPYPLTPRELAKLEEENDANTTIGQVQLP